MRTTITLFFALLALNAFGNIEYVHFDEIPDYEKHIDKINFLKENVRYYNHWEPDWTYDVSKDLLVKNLKEIYEIFSKLDNKNIEINLALGDISHYLYNLSEEEYFDLAVNAYEKSIELSPEDYRPLWFIANHYAFSNVPDKSIEYFLKSRDLLPTDEPAAFWEEFSFATGIANMPSHCIYAMDKAKSILGKPGYFEEQLGKSIHNRIIPVNSDSTYKFIDIWTASKGDLISFVSRPLGLKILVDSTWQINFYDYQNNRAFVTIVPPPIRNKKGRDITYTIAVIINVAQNGEDLDNFINSFIARYKDKKTFTFSNKYPESIAFELKDKNMYQDIGGAHMNMIGIKRDRPEYAGLLLEEPIPTPDGETNELNFYKAGDSQDRFDGEIYYAVMLDACEDIYDEAYKLFKVMFEKQIIIE